MAPCARARALWALAACAALLPARAALAAEPAAVGARAHALLSSGKKAYYSLQGRQVDNATGWPADYADYSLFVCNPASFSAAQLAAARAARPDAVFLAYSCLGWVYLAAQDGCATFGRGNQYYEAMGASFDATLAVRDAATLAPLCVTLGTGKGGVGAYIPSKGAADAFAGACAALRCAALAVAVAGAVAGVGRRTAKPPRAGLGCRRI